MNARKARALRRIITASNKESVINFAALAGAQGITGVAKNGPYLTAYKGLKKNLPGLLRNKNIRANVMKTLRGFAHTGVWINPDNRRILEEQALIFLNTNSTMLILKREG